MLISLNWLKQYVDIKESIDEIANALTMIGQEVEAIEPSFLEDYVEGTNFSASTNVLAKGLKRVGGNK